MYGRASASASAERCGRDYRAGEDTAVLSGSAATAAAGAGARGVFSGDRDPDEPGRGAFGRGSAAGELAGAGHPLRDPERASGHFAAGAEACGASVRNQRRGTFLLAANRFSFNEADLAAW